MHAAIRRRRLRRGALVLLAAPAAAFTLVLAQGPVQALSDFDTPAPVTGNATWFSGLGGPYGGCGMTQEALETQDFVALNVYDTPGDYTYYPRPLTGADLDKRGMWDNGHNCGRWVRVTIEDYCTGTNDGARGLPFCRNGEWISDEYNGATLDLIVADSCGDDNAWCREDPYHLDLSHDSLNRFVKDGGPVVDMDPAHWNNRHVSWQFIPAPDYTGDIQIGFLQGAQTWWGAIAVSRLPNGIHGVEYYADGAWSEAVMDGDMGQAYVIKPLETQGRDFRIRVRDAADELVNGGREYSFSLPGSCPDQCGVAYTKVDYTTSDPGGSIPSTTPMATGPTGTPTATGTPTTGSTGTTPTATCTATYRTVTS